jgi:hypothetical protein
MLISEPTLPQNLLMKWSVALRKIAKYAKTSSVAAADYVYIQPQPGQESPSIQPLLSTKDDMTADGIFDVLKSHAPRRRRGRKAVKVKRFEFHGQTFYIVPRGAQKHVSRTGTARL